MFDTKHYHVYHVTVFDLLSLPASGSNPGKISLCKHVIVYPSTYDVCSLRHNNNRAQFYNYISVFNFLSKFYKKLLDLVALKLCTNIYI